MLITTCIAKKKYIYGWIIETSQIVEIEVQNWETWIDMSRHSNVLKCIYEMYQNSD